MLPGKQLRLCFSVSLCYQNFSAKPCSFYEGFVNVGKAVVKQASRELYSGAFMLSTMLMCRTWRRMAKHTTKVNSMVSAMLSR